MTMKAIKNIPIVIWLVAVSMLTACDEQLSDFSQNYGKDEILVATIAGSESVGTRVMRSSVDNWSYTRFDDVSDVIGFYSLYGNLDGPGGNGPFSNARMEYARGESTSSNPDDRYWRGVFRPVNMNYDIGLIKNEPQNTFVYFPYDENMEKEGMELRRLDDNGIYRCVDALAISKITDDNEAVMSGSFNHTFSEIVIIRGYGFDEPKEGLDRIKVVTTLPYSHARVVDNPYLSDTHPDWKILEPFYDPGYTTLTEQECREWEAWGELYKDGNGKTYPAKYVIIPTAINNGRSTVNYVELHDNNGTLHKVTTFGLMNNGDKRVSPGERYLLTVKLEGLVPTIYPFAITPWKEATSYTEERAKGINTSSEFMQFLLAYNLYNSSGRAENAEEDLKTYGDKYVTDGNDGKVVGWHFYINNDIDLSSLPVSNLNITTLCDTIDGRTNKLYGIKADKAFITELESKGCIRNLNITGLNVTSGDAPAGGLIGQMTGGLVTGCNVDGYLNATGAAGLAVGQLTAGTISNSSFSGLVVGASSYGDKNLVGEAPNGIGLVGEAPNGISPGMIINVNTSGLIFTSTGN